MRGELMARCDADDLFTPGRLAYQVKWMLEHPEFDALCEDLIAALKTHAVPERETKELLTIVVSTRDDIVDPELK